MRITLPRAVVVASCLLLATAALAHHADRNADLQPGASPTAATATAKATDILFESFEATTFPPAGWARLHLSTSYQWARIATASHSGSASAYVRYGPASVTQNEWLVSPALDFTAADRPKLEFYEASPYWASYGGHHYIMVSTTSQTDPAQFTVVADWTPANHEIDESAFGATPAQVSLAAYAGQPVVYVALRYVGADADNWYVDDVRIFEPPLHDVAVTAVSPDGLQFAAADQPTPQVTLVNKGRSIEDFTVTLTVTENDLPLTTETVDVSGLAPDTETVATFSALSLSPGKYYRLQAVANVAGDEVAADNSRTVLDDTYTGPHTPLGQLNTNAGCGPCVQANQALDAWLPGQGDDVACMRVHVWWPGTDGIYNENIPQAQFLANGVGADYAPHMWLDGVVDASSDGAGYAGLYNARGAYHSPLTVAAVWNEAAQELAVTVQVDEPLPPEADLRLRVAVTENNVYYQGSNGETNHNQAFRYMYPTTDGLVVPPTPGTYHYVVPCPLSGSWVYGNLRAIAYVQDNDNWKVHNTVTGFLSALTYVASVGDPSPAARLTVGGVHPNPFNPSATVTFALPTSQPVRVTVHDLEGRLVSVVWDGVRAAGSQTVVWNGRTEGGRPAASGTYVFRIEAGGQTATTSAVLLK